jgi:integrase
MKRVNKEFLTEAELSKIEHKEFEIASVDMIRDLFIFCCYTGLSYIDLMQLRPEHISEAEDGQSWIRTKREKTEFPIVVPLVNEALVLLKKYRKNARANYNGTVFPVISNQKVNLYLKEISKLCGIKKNLTFHMARHTFATTVALSNGVPIETVSKILGHSKIATTQIYARVLEKKMKEDMRSLQLRLKARNASRKPE